MKFIRIIFFSIVLASCSKGVQDSNDSSSESSPISDKVVLTEEQKKNAHITVGNAHERQISPVIRVSGKLEAPPQNTISISTPFAGFIKSTELLPGVAVRKGQVVVELQHPDYIQVQQDYLDLKSQLEFLESEYKRQEELAKESINAQKAVQQAKANYFSTKAKVDGLRAKIKLMNLNLAAVERGEFSSSFALYSSIDGFVTAVNVNIGQFVSPTDPILMIVNTHHLHVELKIFEKDVFRVKQGQSIYFTLNGDTARRKATVYLTGRGIEPDRSITIHGHLTKEDPNLLPGMFVTGEIETNPVKAHVLPDAALVSFEGNAFVFVVEKDGAYKMIPVISGEKSDGMTEITLPEGLGPGTQFVLTGAYTLLSVLKNGPPEF